MQKPGECDEYYKDSAGRLVQRYDDRYGRNAVIKNKNEQKGLTEAMAEVLSQSQIDTLLKSLRNREGDTAGFMESMIMPQKEKTYRTYDFYSPRKFTKEKIKILNSIFESYARILTCQVNGIFRVMTDITVFEVQERRYYEYVNGFHENDCMTLVDTIMPEKGRQNVPMMIHVTPGLVLR